MNGENKKNQGKVTDLSLITYALSITINMIAWYFGFCLRGRIPEAEILAWILGGILILSPGLGGIIMKRHVKRIASRSVQESKEDMDRRIEKVGKDSDGEWKDLRTLCYVTIICIGLLWVLCLLIPFLTGAAGIGLHGGLQIYALLYLSGLVGRFVRRKNQKEDPYVLPEKDFPQLYALAREAGIGKLGKETLKLRPHPQIPEGECNASIVIEKDEVTIYLGATTLCVMDRQELRQILLHEFGHIHREDLRRHRLYYRLLDHLYENGNSLFGKLSDYTLGALIFTLYMKGNLYFTLSSGEKERSADTHAASHGDHSKQLSALAKMCAHDLYAYERKPYENLYISENPPMHMMTDRAKAFREALIQRGGFWRELMEKELDHRISTHPTFRQRWEALDCPAYTLEPAPADTEFARECWSAAEYSDLETAQIPREQYDECRREGYTQYLDAIASYEQNPETATPAQLREVMMAYYSVNMPEKTEILAARILEKEDNPFTSAFARYWRGYLRLHRYDERGIADLYQAMDANSNYVRDGLEEIGTFCVMMGLEQEREEYRRRWMELMQQQYDHETPGITAKADLAPEVLPEGWLERILDFLVKAGGEALDRIYLVRENGKGDYHSSSFILRYREDTPPEVRRRIYEEIFTFLDEWPEQWESALYEFEKEMEKILNKVPGSCIWQREA